MLKIKNNKKIIAIILLILTIFSTVQPVLAVSSSGTGKWTPGQWDSGVFTTDNKTSVGILIRRLVSTTTGEKVTVFCAEHGVESNTGEVDTATHVKPTDPKIKEASKIAYLGWYSKYGDYIVDGGIMAESMKSRKMDYVFTQQMIWEALGQSSATFRDSNIQSQYQSFKADINNKMNRLKTKPSFSDTSVTVEVGESTTLTDSNGVLADYSSIDTTQNDIRFTHNKGENSMVISVGDNCDIEELRITDSMMKSWGLIKEETQDHDTTVYFQFKQGVQNQLYAMNYNDPVSMSLSLKINLFGSLELSKLNKNGDLINNAVFNITGPDGYNENVTVSNGKITIERLKRGTYTIREVSAPYGYLLDTKSYNVEVKANQKATQAVVNVEPTGTFTLIKKNSSKTANLKGAEYRIWNDNYDQTFTTNDDGKIEVSDLKLGKYNYQETKAPEGYLIDENVYSFELKYKDQNTSVIYASAERTDDEPTGQITLIKTDKETGNQDRADKTSHHGDAQIKGAVYTLYAKNDIHNKAKTIKFFSKDEQIATFTFNEYGKASIKITNNNTQAEISIDGDVLKGLPMGTYYAKETAVPIGYMQDTNVYEYTLKFKNNKTPIIKEIGTVTNTVQKAPFEVIKVTTNDNTTAETVANAEFTAILSKYVKFYGSFDEAKKHLSEFAEDEYSIFRTGSDGHGISGLLAYGDYTVNETNTPSSEIETVEEFYVTIDKNSKTPVKELVENDLPFEAYIKLQKQDKKTGKFVTYSNATFELYRLNEENSTWEKVQCKVGDKYYDSWTTNNEGIAKTENKLEAGTYKLDEIKIPTGFIQLDEEVRFEVNNKNKTLNYDKDWDAWITVTAKNEQPTGTLNLKKLVDLRENADKTMIKDIDYTKISFELVADENIIDYADGSVIYEKGKIIDTYKLKNDGTLKVSNLPMGKYHLKELTTIDGAVLDNTEHKVVFTQTDTTTKEYVVDLKIENKTTAIKVSKQDITGEKELVGAKLTILDKENNVIDSWTSTEKAHLIEGLKVGQTYTLREEIAPDFYVKATEIQFTVQNNSNIQTIKMIDKIVEMSKIDIAGNEIEGAELKVLDKDKNIIDSWTSTKEPHKIKGLTEGETYTLVEDYAPNEYVISNSVEFTVSLDKETQKVQMIDKIVEITKTDLTTGKELEGAKLKVVDKNDNVIDEWTSTKEPHHVKGLTEGETYKLVEITAPYGYEITEEIEFTVSLDKETQKIEMKDMPILKNVKVIKIDAATKETIKDKFIFAIYEDPECTKLIKEVDSNKEDGTALFEELRFGTYYIKEIKAPKDYELSNRVVKIEINDKGIFVDDTQVEEKDATIEFTFENNKIEVPKTGDESNIKLFAGAILLSLLGISYIIIRNHKKNKQD